jgi:hypothetical protein
VGVSITPGSGKTIASDTIGGTDYQQVKLVDGTIGSANGAVIDANGNLRVMAGQPAIPTYILGTGPLAPTAAMDLAVIEAPASGVIRLQRIVIWNPGILTAAALVALQLIRKTTAGTAGVVTPSPADPAASAYGGVCRAGVTTRGTDGTVIDTISVFTPTALAQFYPIVIDYGDANAIQSPVIPAGTANGIALKHPGGAGAASFSCSLYFTVGA